MLKAGLINQTVSVCGVCGQISFSSRSWSQTPTVCQYNYPLLYEQPVGLEQMSKLPCQVIRLIHNHRHFHSPSPAQTCHYGARLQSNSILSHRKSISSCCRRAPLIFMGCAGTVDAAGLWTWSQRGMWLTEQDPNACRVSTYDRMHILIRALKYSREALHRAAPVHPSLVHFQLCCHTSKAITVTSLMD